MWIAYVLKLSNKDLSDITIKEYMNMWHAYIWNRRQLENTIAGLVTVYIANSTRGKGRKAVKLEDIFSDGRFDKFLTDKDREIIKELYAPRR